MSSNAKLDEARRRFGLGSLEVPELAAHFGEVYARLVGLEPQRLKLVFNDSKEVTAVDVEREQDGWRGVSVDQLVVGDPVDSVDGVGTLDLKTTESGAEGFVFADSQAEALDRAFEALERGLRRYL